MCVPKGTDECYAANVDCALKNIEESFNRGYFIVDVDELCERLEKTVAVRKFSFIRHAMKSQIMNTVRKVLGVI